jgi:chromosomal replication initiator protein
MNPAEDVNEQTGQLIAKRVAEKFGVKLADLSSQTRKQTTVLARGVAIYLIRSLMLTSFKKIGDQFGNRDHSTVMHSYRKIEAIMKSDDCDESSLRQTVNQLKQELAEQMTDSLMQVSNT